MPRIVADLVQDPREPPWNKPQPGELLFEARDFVKTAKKATKPPVRARYARASLLLSVASVEAISNDTLLCIYQFSEITGLQN
jgi:hypothetical protein